MKKKLARQKIFGTILSFKFFFGNLYMEELRDFIQHQLLILMVFYYLATTIISDCWRAYGGTQQLPEGYRHLTVNHSVNFVDPETAAHTQMIESEWQKWKMRHKKEYGTSRNLFLSYVSDYVWRKKFRGNDVFFYLWSEIAVQYVCESE